MLTSLAGTPNASAPGGAGAVGDEDGRGGQSLGGIGSTEGEAGSGEVQQYTACKLQLCWVIFVPAGPGRV